MSDWKVITEAPEHVPLLLKFPTNSDKGMTLGYWDGEGWRSCYDETYLDQPIVYADIIPREPSHEHVMKIIRSMCAQDSLSSQEDAAA